MKDKNQFSNDLIHWYKINKRDLPFRLNNDPYRIWISEIMLQQTQVITVIPFYNRFIKRFPNIFELAKSTEEEVLKYWEGLGYYSRAKNIHQSANTIVSQYNGIFPADFKTILSLKGIGNYTAGAISSIAFNKREPAVDGNVMRVLSRVFAIWDDISLPKTKVIFEDIVRDLMPLDDVSSFTQGLMELGALVCRPIGQKCQICPFHHYCKSYINGYDDELPVKSKKTKQVNIRLVMAIIQNDTHHFLVRKRHNQGLLANFWEFVQVEAKDFNELQQYLIDHDGILIEKEKYIGQFKHIFTHRIWNIKSYLTTVKNDQVLPPHFKWMTRNEIEQISFSIAHKKILNHLK